MRGIYLRAIATGLGLLAPLALALAAAQHGLGELRELVEARRYPAAHRLAEELLPRYEGTAAFDYLYGLAAVNTGHYTEAALALQRVLMLEPGQHRARLELGRAYFAQGNYRAAREQFAEVLAADPPSGVQGTVRHYLDEIERRELDQRTHWRGQVEVGAGHDSNIASATGNDFTVVIPDVVVGGVFLGDFELVVPSARESDTFASLVADAALYHPLTRRDSLFLRGTAKRRDYDGSSRYDTRTLGLSAGWAYSEQRHLLRVPLTLQSHQIGGEEYRHSAGVGAEWSYTWDSVTMISGYGQYTALRYPSEDALETDLTLVGAGLSRLVPRLGAQVSLSGFLGNDEARDNDLVGKNLWGLRLGAEFRPAPDHVLYGGMGYQEHEYDARNPLFARRREDELVQADVGWRWEFDRSWYSDIRVGYTENASTVALYDYDRLQGQIGLAYRFR